MAEFYNRYATTTIREIIYLVIDNFDGDELNISERYHWISTGLTLGLHTSELESIIVDNTFPHQYYLAAGCIKKLVEGIKDIKSKDIDSFPVYDVDNYDLANTRTRAVLYSALNCSVVKDFYVGATNIYSVKPSINCYKGVDITDDKYIFRYDDERGMEYHEADWILDMVSKMKNLPYNIEDFGLVVPMRNHKKREFKLSRILRNDVKFGKEYVGHVVDITPDQSAIIIKITSLPKKYTTTQYFYSKIRNADFIDDDLDIELFSDESDETKLDSDIVETTDSNERDNLSCLISMNEEIISSLEEKVSELDKEIVRLKDVTERYKSKL